MSRLQNYASLFILCKIEENMTCGLPTERATFMNICFFKYTYVLDLGTISRDAPYKDIIPTLRGTTISMSTDN